MGLDMYFFAEKGCERKPDLPERLKEFENEYSSRGTYSVFEICYFRKFNALHNFIVQNFAGGVDNCNRIYLSEENIEKILSVCERVLQDNQLADSLLPTRSGFFFGSTEYDENYFYKLEKAYDFFAKLLQNKIFEEYDVFYLASW